MPLWMPVLPGRGNDLEGMEGHVQAALEPRRGGGAGGGIGRRGGCGSPTQSVGRIRTKRVLSGPDHARNLWHAFQKIRHR
jgi:hypothetical protein